MSNARQNRWVFTCNDLQNEKFPSQNQLAAFLEEFCVDGVVGTETAPSTGRLHYQGRLKLEGPRQGKTWLLNKLSDLYDREAWTVSHEIDEQKSIEYCKKEKDYLLIGVSKPYGGLDMAVMKNTRPWQDKLEKILEIPWNSNLSRNVYVVYDPRGNTGKSTWLKHYGLKNPGGALKLPTTSVDRLLSIVVNKVNSKKKTWECPICFIDLTRTVGKELSYDDLYHAVEEIKSGWLVDVMYGKGTEAKFDPPPIVIFTNKNLQKEFEEKLSVDRWVWLEIYTKGNGVIDLIRNEVNNVTQSQLFKKKDAEAEKYYPWIKTGFETRALPDFEATVEKPSDNPLGVPSPNINESVSSRYGSEYK